MQADVVHADRGPVLARAVDGDLELARGRRTRVEGRPLAQDLAPHERVDDLVGGHAGEVIRGDVAERVARGLDRVHLHRGELFQDVGHLLELRPVQLEVLARGEVPVAAVVATRDVGELAQLPGAQEAVGNRDAQHRRIALDVEAVPEPQRPELVLAQLAREEAARLVAELRTRSSTRRWSTTS